MITHGDGSLVSNNNPAKAGEEVVVYAVGLGVPPVFPEELYFNYRIGLGAFTNTYELSQLLHSVYTGEVAGSLGLFQINIVIPPMPAQTFKCQGTIFANAIIADIMPATSGTLGICVVP